MAVRRKAAPRLRRKTDPRLAPDSMIRNDSLPWFPFFSPGVFVKLCRVDLATGQMALLVRFEPGSGLATHYHHGVVVTYTVSGQWRYRDAEWTAGPGDVLVEPAGSTHAFEAIGDIPVEAFVNLTGALEFRDESGKTISIESAETLHGRYLAYCALHGIPAQDVARA
jgi:2,4'-dihydroxyacetophenone dioxygenase